jgi:hypothetical protein
MFEPGDVKIQSHATIAAPATTEQLADDVNTRWFNGRRIRPVKTITMVVTAYSPDERS